MENAADIICEQNPEPMKTRGDTKKFIFKNKRNARNLVIETHTLTYRVMKLNKLKIGWTICHTEYYVSMSRFFKCSRFNHHFSDCRSDRRGLFVQGSTK